MQVGISASSVLLGHREALQRVTPFRPLLLAHPPAFLPGVATCPQHCSSEPQLETGAWGRDPTFTGKSSVLASLCARLASREGGGGTASDSGSWAQRSHLSGAPSGYRPESGALSAVVLVPVRSGGMKEVSESHPAVLMERPHPAGPAQQFPPGD